MPSSRVGLSVLGAAFLSLVIAGQGLAVSAWTPRVTVGAGWWLGGLATTGKTAVVSYEDEYCPLMCIDSLVYVRRSTDGGRSWGARHVFHDASDSSLAAYGRYVDLVWVGGGGVRYARSTDVGLTFAHPVPLAKDSVRSPLVARGPGGLVAVGWVEWPGTTEQFSVRVSRDGGVTFGHKTSWMSSHLDTNALAVGDGVIFAAFEREDETEVVVRSTDAGATWSTALKLSGGPLNSDPSIAAVGRQAYVAYGAVDRNEHREARYRRTDDAGTSWSAPRAFSPASFSAYNPVITVNGGVLRALIWTDDGSYYTQSTDGLAWSAPEFVTSDWTWLIGYARNPIVVYQAGSHVYARSRLP